MPDTQNDQSLSMNPLRDIAALFFPPVCAACGKPLPDGGDLLCNYCRWEIPLTRFWERGDNAMAERLRAHVPVVEASAFYFFVHGSAFRDLIHDFKYRGRWRVAMQMGRWYGAELAASGRYGGIDAVIPVPLHWRKRIVRGYNQAEYIARGISASLGTTVDTHSVCAR